MHHWSRDSQDILHCSSHHMLSSDNSTTSEPASLSFCTSDLGKTVVKALESNT
jgi:hypothetical protein